MSAGPAVSIGSTFSSSTGGASSVPEPPADFESGSVHNWQNIQPTLLAITPQMEARHAGGTGWFADMTTSLASNWMNTEGW